MEAPSLFARFFLAIRFFFSIVFHPETARRCLSLNTEVSASKATAELMSLGSPSLELPLEESQEKQQPHEAAAAPKEDPAITRESWRQDGAYYLLEKLQEEGRLLDFCRQPIDEFTDEQVGMASRVVHAGIARAIKKLGTLEPLSSEAEGSRIQINEFPNEQIEIDGVTSTPPQHATLIHPGWRMTALQLPYHANAKPHSGIIARIKVEVSK